MILDKIKARRLFHRAQLSPLFLPFFDKQCELIDQNTDGQFFAPYCSIRTATEQDDLYAQGRTEPGKKTTNARAWESPHQYGMACDWASFRPDHDPWADADWNLYGKCSMFAGLRWGGDWNGDGLHEPEDFDRPHSELKINVSWMEVAKIRIDQGQDAALAFIELHLVK